MPAPIPIPVSEPSDADRTGQAARLLAASVGFDPVATEEIAIAARELASNLVKHARGGTITLTPLSQAERSGVQIESLDRGPGILDPENAIADGCSTSGSLGSGLGAINRLMDELDISSAPDQGTRILCRRWIRPTAHAAPLRFLDFGAASRPHRYAQENGDAFVIKRWAGGAIAGVIDGLGHGVNAHRAALAARQYVESHFDQPLAAIFLGVGRACRATRGVVMALAQFHSDPPILSFASIGNVEARLCQGPEPARLVVRRGVLGVNAPNPVVIEQPWHPHFILVMHSDGLKSQWRWEDFLSLAQAPATFVAAELLRRLSKNNDDATVLVAKAQHACSDTPLGASASRQLTEATKKNKDLVSLARKSFRRDCWRQGRVSIPSKRKHPGST